MVNRLDVHTYIYFELASFPIESTNLGIYRHLELNIKPLTTSNGRPTSMQPLGHKSSMDDLCFTSSDGYF